MRFFREGVSGFGVYVLGVRGLGLRIWVMFFGFEVGWFWCFGSCRVVSIVRGWVVLVFRFMQSGFDTKKPR